MDAPGKKSVAPWHGARPRPSPTHGAPTENNAHPHFAGRVAVVHNGIIENFASLREELKASGAEFVTQTDTEVVAHLVSHYLSEGMSSREAYFHGN